MGVICDDNSNFWDYRSNKSNEKGRQEKYFMDRDNGGWAGEGDFKK